MRRALLFAVALCAGCSSGPGTVVLQVLGSTSGIDQLQLVATVAGARSQPSFFTRATKPFSLPQTLNLQFDADRSGALTLEVTALDAKSQSLASGTVSGTLTPGQSTDLTVTLGSTLPDGGAADHAALPDLAATDLPPPDLAPPVSFAMKSVKTDIPSQAIVAGLVGADPFLDLVILDSGSAQLSVIQGLPAGNFQATPPISTNSTLPTGLLNAEFVKGGFDLAISSPGSGQVSTFYGQDGGILAPGASFALPGASAMVYGPLAKFRNYTLAVLSQANNGIDVVPPDVSGMFDADGGTQIGLAGPMVSAMVSADFDQDGWPDLLVANQGDGSLLRMLASLHNGTFTMTPLPLGTNAPHALLAAAFDEASQVAHVAVVEADKVSVFHNDGKGALTPKWSAMLNAPTSAVAGDFNGDGKLDLAVSLHDDNSVAVFLGRGDCTFDPPIMTKVPDGPSGMVAADFDGNGRADLAVTSSTNNVGILFAL